MIKHITPSHDMAALIAIAHAAGQMVMKIYAGADNARLKNDNSPVTDADLAAEKVILAGLAKCDPTTPVISEEATAAGKKPQSGPRFYLVDPLDGTKEFISKNGEFTVNIAVIEAGEPVAGVVYAPACKRMFWGERRNGAAQAEITVDDDITTTKWHSLKTTPLSKKSLRVVASRSHRDAATDDWLAQHDVGDIIAAGSSLKFCLIAAAEADIYPRFGRTMEWDTAAGHAVLAAAGGKVMTVDGIALTYGKIARNFDNPGFIASGN